ncbi:hypothetical protein [Microcystis sp. 0824]|uniref:hypothetical protein n=1 Tax=Microcystis sp. 0824 TaxID=1502726 RepID=UPI001E3E8CFF|nr:hypothetical protein [Microcystis sp. 0824]
MICYQLFKTGFAITQHWGIDSFIKKATLPGFLFFLAFLKNEKDKINDCISVLKAAADGQVICHRRLL